MSDMPDENWYTAQSKKSKLPHHCPVASITGCPRYFASLYHAQRAKILSGEIPEEIRNHLLDKWKSEDVFLIDDRDVATSYNAIGHLIGVSNFCPEIVGLLNGLYCSDYKVDPDDSKVYLYIHSKHYKECLEFSVLGYEEKDLSPVDRGITADKRFMVLKRDSFKCVYCGRYAPDVMLHIDHKISRSDGGGDEISNLVTACSQCNIGKGSASTF